MTSLLKLACLLTVSFQSVISPGASEPQMNCGSVSCAPNPDPRSCTPTQEFVNCCRGHTCSDGRGGRYTTYGSAGSQSSTGSDGSQSFSSFSSSSSGAGAGFGGFSQNMGLPNFNFGLGGNPFNFFG